MDGEKADESISTCYAAYLGISLLARKSGGGWTRSAESTCCVKRISSVYVSAPLLVDHAVGFSATRKRTMTDAFLEGHAKFWSRRTPSTRASRLASHAPRFSGVTARLSWGAKHRRIAVAGSNRAGRWSG